MIKKFILFSFTYFVFMISINAYTAYNQGDIVTYKENNYYVLYDRDASSNVLTLLKKEPLTVAEVEKYGVGHINNYSLQSQHQVTNYNDSGYGGIAYYSSEQCGIFNNETVFNDCKYDYSTSEIKHVVDSWAKDNLIEKDLWKDELGYSYRLITKDEILEYMNYSLADEYTFAYAPIIGKTPQWLYDERYSYWSMTDINRVSSLGYTNIGVYQVNNQGEFFPTGAIYVGQLTIRPVILLKKSALEKKSNNISNNSTNSSNNSGNKSNTSNTNNTSNYINVSVPDTFTKVSILSITIGIILVGTCVTIYVYIKKRNK